MFAVFSVAGEAKALLIMPEEHKRTAQRGPAFHPTETHQMAGANQHRNEAKGKVTATWVCSSEAIHAARFALAIGTSDLISHGTQHLPTSAGGSPRV